VIALGRVLGRIAEGMAPRGYFLRALRTSVPDTARKFGTNCITARFIIKKLSCRRLWLIYATNGSVDGVALLGFNRRCSKVCRQRVMSGSEESDRLCVMFYNAAIDAINN
jgi:hypothetical protein